MADKVKSGLCRWGRAGTARPLAASSGHTRGSRKHRTPVAERTQRIGLDVAQPPTRLAQSLQIALGGARRDQCHRGGTQLPETDAERIIGVLAQPALEAGRQSLRDWSTRLD